MGKYEPGHLAHQVEWVWKCPCCGRMNSTETLTGVVCAYETDCGNPITEVPPHLIVTHRIPHREHFQETKEREQAKWADPEQRYNEWDADRLARKKIRNVKLCPVCQQECLWKETFCPTCGRRFG